MNVSMRSIFRGMILSAAVAGVIPSVSAQPTTAPAAATQGADVPVKQVVLFSSGVGYFEHFGSVHGQDSTELRFKTNQINDILKSLVLQDLDGGKVSTVTYPSQDPVEKTLKSFQVDITGNPPLGELLNQLRGAKVKVIASEQWSGTVLGVEYKQKPGGKDDKSIPTAVLNLIAGGTIRSILLDDVRSIELEDAQLQDELNRALLALAGARDQDKKPVSINFQGEGERRVRIGYVVETPIWKTSYRLILDDSTHPKAAVSDDPATHGNPDLDKTGKPQANAPTTTPSTHSGALQGWAIVENQTDNDWDNVQLSLVSGRPISFVQNLYQPLYIPRPVVQPELFASLKPQTYDAGMGDKNEAMQMMDAPAASAAPMMQRAAKSPGGARGGGGGGGGGRGGAGGGPNFSLSGGAMAADSSNAEMNRPMDAASSVSSVASASQIGELFQYTVGNVSLPRQRSAMIPIITDDIEVEKLSIYNMSVLPRNPLNGARIKNTTDKHLLQGPVTVLESSSYAGDAKIDNVPPGQERLLSYGVDLQMLVDATKNSTESTIRTGRIVQGVLYVQRKHVYNQNYVAENKSGKDKMLVIEHPRRGGDWKLVETANKPIEKTDSLYRFKGSVPAGKSTKLTITEEMVQDEAFAILPWDIGQIEFYSRTGEIPQKVRDVLIKAIAYKQALAATERSLNEKNQQLGQVTGEQGRIRENMKTVEKQSQYYARLQKKLDDQETLIEKTQTERDDLQKKLEAQRKELEDYLNNTTIG